MIERRGKKGPVTIICDLVPAAGKVYLAGDFNSWDPRAKRMSKAKDGTFRARMKLSSGQHEYKFVADGLWLNDPASDGQVINPFGTLNSTLCVE